MTQILNDKYEGKSYHYKELPIKDEIGLSTECEVENKSKRSYWAEYKAAHIANLGKLLVGLHLTGIGAILPELLSGTSRVTITMAESVWVINFLQVGAIPGPIIGSLIADRFGRRPTIILISIPFFLASFITIFAKNMIHLCAARLFAGMSVGAVLSVIPMYVGEISSPEIRGFLSMTCFLNNSFGFLLSYILSACVPLQTNAIICTILPTIMFILTYFYLPESPYFYILTQDAQNAEKTLKLLRRKSSVTEEIKRMKDGYEENKKEKQSFTDIFTINTNRRAMLIICGLIFGAQLNGTMEIIHYAQVIFQDGHSSIPISICGIISALSNFVCLLIVAVLIDRLGRRILLMSSSILSIVGLLILGFYFYLQDVIQYSNISQFTFIPMLTIIFIKLGYALGIATLPFLMLAELLPTEVKAQCSSYATILTSILAIISTKLYQLVLSNTNYSVTFYMYIPVNAFIFIFVYCFVPETKGLTFERIQENLRKTVKSWV